MRQDIKNLSFCELEKDVLSLGLKSYLAKQIFHWLYTKNVTSFEAMPNIAKTGIVKLEEKFFIGNPPILKRLKSKDGTEKFLLGLLDNEVIETVFIPSEKRNTVCLSSQVGCKFKCLFCASGMNFIRQLSVSEITSQLSKIRQVVDRPITHLVFMGIGEPMDNYDNIISAIRIFNSSLAFNIGARRITVSTCGIIPGIKRLSSEGLQVELSISLHAPYDELRATIMPVDKKYPVEQLIGCARDYIDKTNRQVTFEYVLIKGLNDHLADADRLSDLLGALNAKVNLIVYNHRGKSAYQAPEKKIVFDFKNRLLKNGTRVTLRLSRGQDIDAACGQLRLGKMYS